MTDELKIVASTIYGEARGELTNPKGGIAALICVGNVIFNRLREPERFGENLTEICKKKYQFSCWNTCDPNSQILRGEAYYSTPVWQQCFQVAQNLKEGRWPDLTGGSNHYHSTSCRPNWVEGKKIKIQIGNHIFYRF